MREDYFALVWALVIFSLAGSIMLEQAVRGIIERRKKRGIKKSRAINRKKHRQ